MFPLKKLTKFGSACKQILSGLLSSLQNILDFNKKINNWGVGFKPLLGSKWRQGRDRFMNECKHPMGNLQQLSGK